MLTEIKIIDTQKENAQKIEGKLLGLITDREYAVISKKRSIMKSLLTGESVKLKSITNTLLEKNSAKYRLVVNVRYIDNIYKSKHLFISSRLNFLTSYFRNENKYIAEIWIDDNTYMVISESEEV